MKPRTKKLLIAIGALAALMLAALLVAPRFIDADSFRPRLQAMAREKLGRDVTLGELGVSFLPPSVTIRDVSVAGSAGTPDWITAKGVRVRAAWSGLLTGDIEVQGIALDEPSVRVLRSPDGRWNLQELVPKREAGADAGKQRRAVSVDRVSIRQGRIELADAFVKPGEVVRMTLTDVDASIDGIGSGRGLDADISAAIEGGGRAAWRGTIGPGTSLDGHVSSEDLDVARLVPYLAERLGLPAMAGVVTSELDLVRGERGTTVRGDLEIDGLRVGNAATAADVKAGLDVAMDPAGAMDLKRLDLRTGETEASVRGGVTSSPAEQVLTLEIDAPKLRPQDLVALAAAAGQSLPLGGLQGERLALKGKARVVRQGEPRTTTSIALDGVEASGLRLALRKEAGGSWGLVGRNPSSVPSKDGGPGPALRVRGLRVTDSALRLEDASVSPPSVVEITGVAAGVESWAPGEAGTIDLTANVASGRVSLKGRVAAPGAAAKPWDARLSVSGLNLAEAGALASAAGLQPKAGRADWDATITGTPGTDLKLAGRLQLKGAKLPLAGGREVTLDLPIDHDVALLDEGRIRLDALTLGLPGGPLALEGRVQRGDVLRYDVGTKGRATLTPEAVSWLVALMGQALPFDLELSEPLTLDARARNAGGGLELAGEAQLQRARVRHELLGMPLDVARASVAMRGDRVEVQDASLRLGASELAGSLSFEDFDEPSIRFDLSAPRADLDELFAIASRSRGEQRPAPDGKPMSQRLRASGRLRVDEATFGGMAFSAFDTTVDMRDGRLLFHPARLALYGGTGSGRAAFDLAGGPARFDADVQLEGVDVAALLTAGVGYSDLSGRGRLSARLQGRAGSLQEALAAVRGDGELHLVDGEIGKLNALQALERASVFGEQSLSALAGRLSREGTPFSTLDATFVVENGTLRITDSKLVAPDADIASQGTSTFADKGVDVQSLIAFSKPLSEQMRAEGSRAAQVFWDPGLGQVVLPARITGRIGELKATIDWKAAGAQILRSGALGSILGGTARPSGTTGPLAGDPVGGLLGQILGGGREPSRPEEPAPATAAQAASLPGRGDAPAFVLEQARSAGNFLTPDLRVRGSLQGTDLSHAVVVVSTPEGAEVAREDRAFADAVSAHYAAAPRGEPASIPVRVTFDFARLGGTGPFVVTVEPVDADGRRGEPVRAQVAKTSPF